MSFWRNAVVDPLRRVNRESREFLASPAGHAADGRVMLVLLTAAVCLTLQHYCLTPRSGGQMERLTWWFVGSFVVQFVIPALVIRLILRGRIRDFGTSLEGVFSGFPTYVAMLAVTVPLIVVASASPGFQETYPYYRLAPGEGLWPNFWKAKALHLLGFFSLEFFFRGFLVHGTRLRFGAYSIFVMMVPYCMIHFGKPLPETFASILAGLALGFMSLKTRSIWMGTAIHFSASLAMDLTALWRVGYWAAAGAGSASGR